MGESEGSLRQNAASMNKNRIRGIEIEMRRPHSTGLGLHTARTLPLAPPPQLKRLAPSGSKRGPSDATQQVTRPAITSAYRWPSASTIRILRLSRPALMAETWLDIAQTY